MQIIFKCKNETIAVSPELNISEIALDELDDFISVEWVSVFSQIEEDILTLNFVNSTPDKIDFQYYIDEMSKEINVELPKFTDWNVKLI